MAGRSRIPIPEEIRGMSVSRFNFIVKESMLTPDERITVQKFVLERWALDDIAAELYMARGTVSKLLRHALQIVINTDKLLVKAGVEDDK